MNETSSSLSNNTSAHHHSTSSQEIVDVSNQNLTSFKSLPNPQKITQLNISFNQISHFEEDEMKKLTNVSKLDISHNKIKKIELLFYSSFISIDFSFNQLTSIEHLEGVTYLERLNLSDNQISRIYLRSPLPRLAYLNLSNNPITNLMGIRNFPRLSFLNLSQCKFSTLTQLKTLLNLRVLILSDCGLDDSEPIGLPLLTKLDVSKNNFKSLGTFNEFPSLISLNLSECPLNLTSFPKTMKLNNIKELKMNHCPVKSLSFLPSLFPQLFVFTSIGAMLDDKNDVVSFLNNLPDLRYFNIKGCPVNREYYPDDDLYAEYTSIKEYDFKFPEKSNSRAKYREEMENAANKRLFWLDGIRVLGRDAKHAPKLSMYNVINEDGNVNNFENYLLGQVEEEEDVPEFWFKEEGDPNRIGTDDDEEIFYSQIHNHKLLPIRTGCNRNCGVKNDDFKSGCHFHPIKHVENQNPTQERRRSTHEKKSSHKRKKIHSESVDYI